MSQRESRLTVTFQMDFEWPAALGGELPSLLLMIPIWLSVSSGAQPLAYRFPRKPLLCVAYLQESGSSDSSSIFSHTAFPTNALSVGVDYFIWSWSPRPSPALTYTEQTYYHASLLWDRYLLCTWKIQNMWVLVHFFLVHGNTVEMW